MHDESDRPRLLEISQVGRRLNLSDESVRQLIHRGELPAILINKRWRIERDDLERFIAARRFVPGDKPTAPRRKLQAVPQNGAA